jgi:pilus assembly protein CpaC
MGRSEDRVFSLKAEGAVVSRQRIRLFGWTAAAFIAAGLLASPQAFAQKVTPAGGAISRVSVVLNKSESYKVDVPFADVLVGSSDIADVIPLSDRQLYILGKKVGTTNVTLYDRNKRLLSIIDVDVRMDTSQLESKIRSSSGSRNIRVGSIDNKLVLSGTAEDSQALDRAVNVAAGLAPGGVVNAMNVNGSQQVMLKVRFVEADRSAERALGVKWGVFSGNGNLLASIGRITAGATGQGATATILSRVISTDSTKVDLVLTALEQQGFVRRLAEPNLVALSGETADFLAGGEFPVPVSASTTNGFPTTTIEFKEFGVGLAFTPTVLAGGVISLKLEPTVSELDYTNAVRLSGVEIPGLVKRRAKTTIELRDGQSFAMAGLLQSQSARTLDQVPWLGSVPVLGALFRSPSFQQKESELVIIVTPYLVKPVPPGKQLRTPLDNTLNANDLDFFLNGRGEIPKRDSTLINAQNQDVGPVGGAPAGAPGRDDTRLLAGGK